MNPHRKDRPVRNAIPRKSAGYDAGVVFKTRFHKCVKSPECIPDNRKIRGTISCNLLSGDLFEEVLGTTNVGQKFVGGLLSNCQMPIAVARHFMTVCLDLLDDMGKAFGELAKHEHRGPHLCFTEKTKNTPRILNRSIRDRKIPVPFGLRPVFNVDGDDRGAVAHGLRHT